MNKFDTYAAPPYEAYQLKYGFMNKPNVCQYMQRIDPQFAYVALLFNTYKKDERIHNDYEDSWKKCQNINEAVVELTPEHYYLPEMLLNFNNYSSGVKSYKKYDDREYFHSNDVVYLP